MSAKELVFKEVKPEVFQSFAFRAEIEVLKLNGKPAYFQVAKVYDNITASFWCHNQGFVFKNYCKNPNDGMDACQEWFNNLIESNSTK